MKKSKNWQLPKEEYAAAFSKVIDDKFIDFYSRAITAYAFRNGPIEDMHANPKMGLGQKEMKTLNKYMVNRLAGLFTAIKQGRFDAIDVILGFNYHTTSGWDKPEPDISDFEILKTQYNI